MAQENVQEREIRSVFSSLKSAVALNNGKDAVNYIDSNTVVYYNFLLDKTLHADSLDLDTMSAIHKVMIYTLRDGVSETYLESMNGVKLFQFLVDNELLSRSTILRTNIGDVLVDGNKALGQLLYPGNESPYYLKFNKEDGLWKLDATSLLPLTAQSAVAACKKREELMRQQGF